MTLLRGFLGSWDGIDLFLLIFDLIGVRGCDGGKYLAIDYRGNCGLVLGYLGATNGLFWGALFNGLTNLVFISFGTYVFRFDRGLTIGLLATCIGGKHRVNGACTLTTMLTEDGLYCGLDYCITNDQGTIQALGQNTTCCNTILGRVLGVCGIAIIRVLHGVIDVIRVTT